MSYFCYDGHSFEEYESLHAAITHSQEAVEWASDEADPYWPDWVENIRVGVIIDSVASADLGQGDDGSTRVQYSIGNWFSDEMLEPEDEQDSSYDVMANNISSLPQTWVPAVLAMVLEAAIDKDVFNLPDGLASFIDRVVSRKLAEQAKGEDGAKESSC